MGIVSELFAHTILLGFAAYVIVSANPGSSLFSWHPTCMVLAWVLFNEGIILFRKPSPAWRVFLHNFLQFSGMVLALIGGFCIYTNKENSGKPHFETYHGIFGVLTQVLLNVQSIGGNVAKYSIPLTKKLPFIKPKVIKWGHRMSGAVSLSALTFTVFLSLFSLWFNAITSHVLIWWIAATLLAYPLMYSLKVKTTYF